MTDNLVMVFVANWGELTKLIRELRRLDYVKAGQSIFLDLLISYDIPDFFLGLLFIFGTV